MRKRFPLVATLFLVLAILACNLPQPGPTTEAPPVEETPTEEPTLESTATEEPAPEPLVVIFAGGNFEIYNLDGTLSETRPAAGLTNWAHPNSYQIIGDAIYYVDSGGTGMSGSVKRVTPGGVDDLAFTAIPNMKILTFSVNADESMIAWAAAEWANSELWTANIDGSDTHTVTQFDPTSGMDEFYVLEVYRWSQAGNLFYVWQISGIGDLLYFGYSSMYGYDPATNTYSTYYPASTGGGMLCWNVISPDDTLLTGTCDGGSGIQGLRERNLATSAETVLPLLPDQQQTGGVSYSPSGTQLAFAFGSRGMDPGDINGWIAVRTAPGVNPAVVTSIANGFFQKTAWASEDLLVVQGTENYVVKTYLLTLDGAITYFADGELIGLMWP
jgi:hypothetical protein